MSSNEIIFLLGSGPSIAMGLPNIYEITNALYPLVDIYKSSDNMFYIGQPPNNKQFPNYLEYNKPISTTIAFCIYKIESYYNYLKNYRVNYEDIYYLVTQIHDNLSGDYENPAIVTFQKELEDNLSYFLNNGLTYMDMISNTIGYIENMVWHCLSREIKNLKKMQCIVD